MGVENIYAQAPKQSGEPPYGKGVEAPPPPDEVARDAPFPQHIEQGTTVIQATDMDLNPRRRETRQ